MHSKSPTCTAKPPQDTQQKARIHSRNQDTQQKANVHSRKPMCIAESQDQAHYQDRSLRGGTALANALGLWGLFCAHLLSFPLVPPQVLWPFGPFATFPPCSPSTLGPVLARFCVPGCVPSKVTPLHFIKQLIINN